MKNPLYNQRIKCLLFAGVFTVFYSLAYSQSYETSHGPYSISGWKKECNGPAKSVTLSKYRVTVDTNAGRQKKFVMRTFNSYNKKGMVTETYNNFISEDTADNSTRILTEYSGLKRSKIIAYRKYQGKSTKQIYTYKYTALTNDIFLGVTTDTNPMTYRIEYDSAGNIIEEKTLYKGKLMNLVKNTYDNKGRCIEVLQVTHSIFRNPVKTDSNKWGYIYNDKGLCIEEDFYNVANDSVVAKNLYKYDNKGDMIQEIDIRENKTDTITIVYNGYDTYGNWLTAKETDSQDNKQYVLLERNITY